MSDAINAACRALQSAAARFRKQADHWRVKIPDGSTKSAPAKAAAADDKMAEECEMALADLRLMASGDERFK